MQATGLTRRMIQTATATCLAATLALQPAEAAPQVLSQMPQDADAVFIVPDLADLSGKIASLRQALNLPMPEFDDALGAFKQSTGMTAGMNDNGGMLVVMPDLSAAMAENRKPQALVLVPVSDYAAFVGNFGGNANEDVTTLTMPGVGQAFGRRVGDYAVISETRDGVQAYAAGDGNAGQRLAEKVGELGRQYLDESDAMVFIDLEAMAPALLPLIDQSVSEMNAQFQGMADMGMMDAASVGQIQAVYNLYGSAARTIIQDGTGLLLSLEVTDAGVGMTQSLGYKANSELATYFPARQADTSGLGNLPEQPFIFAMALDAEAIALGPLYEQLAEAMGPGENAMMPVAPEVWLPLIRNLRGVASSFYAPNDMALMSGSVFNTVTVLDVDNPRQYIADLKNYITQMDGLEIPIAGQMDLEGRPGGPGANPDAAVPGGPGGAGAGATIRYTTAYNDGALQLQGVQVDQYQVTANLPPQMMQQMGPAAGFMQMFTNYGGYVAEKDGKVLITTVIDPQMVTKGFQAIAEGGGIGSAGAIGRVRDANLPPNPAMEAYISVSGIAQTANIFMGMMNMPPIEAPADLPPLAMGVSSQERSLASRVYLPTETLRFLVETSQNLIGPMMGGHPHGPHGPHGPGRPGGPPPF